MLSFKSLVRTVKFAAIAFAFIIFIATNATPAFAFGSSPSKPTDGEVNLSEVRAKAEKVSNSQPRSSDKVSSIAQKGLNSVQGAVEHNKMIKEAPDATTEKDDIASGIKNIVGQD